MHCSQTGIRKIKISGQKFSHSQMWWDFCDRAEFGTYHRQNLVKPYNMIATAIAQQNSKWFLILTRSSATAGRPCDAKACQGLQKWTWKWQPRLKWPSKYFKVIKSGTNRKLVYDFPLVVYSNFCRITHRFWEIWCETVQSPWNMPKVIDSRIIWKLSCGHVCKMFGRQ